jgi:hypothetical protein
VLPTGAIHGGDPTLPGVIDAGIGYPEGLRRLDPDLLILQEDVDALSGAPVVHIQATGVEPNLALPAHLVGSLAEAENPPEARRFDGTAGGHSPR